MSNVIKFKTSSVDSFPDDLMKIGEFVKKYKVDRSYPYKPVRGFGRNFWNCAKLQNG